jgi:hypothetical protein
MQKCFKCENQNLVYREIEFYKIWMCDHCGQSGVIYLHPKCCNNPDTIEIRSETSDGKWQRRIACKTCKSLSGKVLKQGNDFQTLPFLTYEKSQEYGLHRSKLHEKCLHVCRDYTEAIKEKLRLIHKTKYDKYLQSPFWKQKSAIVKERDKYLCQMCLTEKATEVHHITYDRLFNELTSDLISVCSNCHKTIHNK